MRPFILFYSQKQELEEEVQFLDYSYDLSLNVIYGTNEPAVNLATSCLSTFTKAGEEPTDNNKIKSSLNGNTFTRTKETTAPSRVNKFGKYLRGETHTLVSREVTDFEPSISRIAKRMSLETLTEARESTDIR